MRTGAVSLRNTVVSLCSCVMFLATSVCVASESSTKIVPNYVNVMSALQKIRQSSLNEEELLSTKRLALDAINQSASSGEHQTKQYAYYSLALISLEENDVMSALDYFDLAVSDEQVKLEHIVQAIELAHEFSASLIKRGFHNSGYELIDRYLPLASSNDLSLSVAQLHILKARALYDQKRNSASEEVYKLAIEVLTGSDIQSRIMLGDAFHQVGQIYKRRRDFEKSTYYHKLALEQHLAIDDKSLIVQSIKNVAINEFKSKNYLAALDYVFTGLETHKTLNEPEERAELFYTGGMIYRYLYRYEKSLEFLNEALGIYTQTGNLAKQADSSNQIGLLFTRLEKYDLAASYYQKSIDLPDQHVPDSTRSTAYRELAKIELVAGKYESANHFARKAHAIYLSKSDDARSALTASIKGDIANAQDKLQQASTHYKESLWFAEKADDYLSEVLALTNLAELSLLAGNSEEASSLYSRALNIANAEQLLEEKAPIYSGLISIQKAQGDYKNALSLAQNLLEVERFIYAKKEQNELAFAKAKLESHKLETEIASLREKVKFDQLVLEQKNNELEIGQQAHQISVLELEKKRYANTLLGALLVISVLVGLYVYKISMTSRKRNKELDYLATHDQLTNCLNRRGLFEQLNQHFERIESFDDYSMIMADVDRFKGINDKFGHATGDKVLKAVAEILQNCVRKDDVVARYGGEEFCIALLNTHVSQAKQIAEKMRQNIEKSTIVDLSVTCSFGIASIDKSGDTASDLISKADTALYYAKSSGRNRTSIHEPGE